MTLKLWERKWEIDSLAAVLKLSTEYVKVTNDFSVVNRNYTEALFEILDTLETNQDGMRE